MTIGANQITDHRLSNSLTTPAPSSGDNQAAIGKKQRLETSQSSVSLSQLGKINQEIDVTANTIDSILVSGMSKEQKKEVGELFKQLDSLFDKNPTGAGIEQQADKLLNRVDSIMESTFNKLPKNQQDSIVSLSKRVEQLESNLELEQQLTVYSQQEIIASAQQSGQMQPSENKKQLLESSHRNDSEKSSKKALSTAQLNSLSAAELRKLPAGTLKKLSAAQLNKLSTAQLNNLDLAQLKRLSSSAVSKLNEGQLAKLNNG